MLIAHAIAMAQNNIKVNIILEDFHYLDFPYFSVVLIAFNMQNRSLVHHTKKTICSNIIFLFIQKLLLSFNGDTGLDLENVLHKRLNL